MAKFCENCGNKLTDEMRFCNKCGAAVSSVDNTQNSAQTIDNAQKKEAFPNFTAAVNNSLDGLGSVNITKNKNLLKWLIPAAGLVLAIIIAIIVFVSCSNQPESRMNRAISDGKLSEAYSIYSAEMYGKPFSEETVKALKSYADGVVSDFENGEITYSAAIGEMRGLDPFIGNKAELDNYIGDKNQKLSDLNNFQSALNQADKYYNDKNYLSAMQEYNRALELNGKSEEAQNGAKKAKDEYRKYVISQADECISENDYSQAKSYLNAGLQNIPGDDELQKKIDGLEDDQVQSVVDDAYAYTESGDWSGALKLLEEAQSTYMSNEKIKTAYEDIVNKMPITLKNITTVSSDEVEVIEEAVKDRYGNVYDGCAEYDAYRNAYGLYSLAGKYKTFKATAFVTQETAVDSKISLSIYIDDELVLFKDNISEETKPIGINLDISGKQTMKIVTKGKNGQSISKIKIAFGDTSFEKIDEAKAEHSSEPEKATSKKDD